MDKLYYEITNELLEELQKFKENKTSYEKLYKLFEKEDILRNFQNWDKMEREMKKGIFEYQNNLYKHLLEVERDIKEYESLDKDKEIEVNIEDLSIHANMLSRNREPPEGFGNSPWYLPCFPNLNMIEHLHEKDEL